MKKLTMVSFILIALYLAFHFFTLEKDLPAWQTAKPELRDIVQSVQAGGVMEAKEQVDVGAQVTGQVVKLHVSEGEKVSKGQLLAEIDPTIARNKLKTAESNLAKARAVLEKARATLRLNTLTLKRTNELYTSGALSSSDKEKAEADYAVSRADVDDVKTDIVNAEVGVEIARSELGYNMISAPVSGTVVSIISKEGQTLVSTQTVPVLLRLGSLEQMTVKTRISEADVVKLKTGLPVKFSLIGQPGKAFHARP